MRLPSSLMEPANQPPPSSVAILRRSALGSLASGFTAQKVVITCARVPPCAVRSMGTLP
jgi:hypothetical protein